MNILRKSKETVAGGGLFLALLALSVSGVASAGQGCGMQLVDDNYRSGTELVATSEDVTTRIVVEPIAMTGDLDPTGPKPLDGDGGFILEITAVVEIGGGSGSMSTDDDNYKKAWPKPMIVDEGTGIVKNNEGVGIGKTLLAGIDLILDRDGVDEYGPGVGPILDQPGIGKMLIASADGALMKPNGDGIVEGLLNGGGMTIDGSAGADGTSLAWSANPYTV